MLLIRCLLVGSLAAAASSGIFAAQAPKMDLANRMPLYAMDSWIGDWSLDIKRSEFNPGPPLKNGILKIDMFGAGIRCTLNRVDAVGSRHRTVWTALHDGKDHSIEMDPHADSISLKRIDDYTLETIFKHDGKEILQERWIVSPDKRELKITQTGKDASGKAYTNTLVYARQSFDPSAMRRAPSAPAWRN